MPRSRADGTSARPPRRARLTDRMIRRVKPEAAAFSIWDTHTRGLALRVLPTGSRSWKYVYSRGGRPRWLHIGRADAIALTDARRIAARHAAAVADGADPVSEMRARGAGTFREVAERYVREHSSRKNKSWKQAHDLVCRYLLPKWSNLSVKAIDRADVRRLVGAISGPVLSNQILAAASAIFSWAVRQDIVAINPCKGVERNEVRSRERVLSDRELPLFWKMFDHAGLLRSAALKLVLLTGARPGEICRMRREHVKDDWWHLPGAPDLEAGWLGTKNGRSHRVWLSEPARRIINELMDGEPVEGFVIGGDRPIADLAGPMRQICAELGVKDKATPHDLRRSFATFVAALGFGRSAVDRVLNHADNSVAGIYDRHSYSREDQHIWEAVGRHITAIATGEPDARADNVVRMVRGE